MMTDEGAMTRYVRVATGRHQGWARQLGTFQGGSFVAFAMVDATGRDLGQVLLADSAGLALEPAVLRSDGLQLAARYAQSPRPTPQDAVSADGGGLEVLVVEDEFVIALDLAQTLRDLGCSVLGPAASVAEALALLSSARPDVALLDVHMEDGMVTPVARRLAQAGVPFVLTTADDEARLDPALKDAAILPKPYSARAIRQAIRQAVRKGCR